ncbi:MAG TPA: cytochrome B [Bacteroidia bacterium]|nr:cytochrome B [Bacteroidia bacterium]
MDILLYAHSGLRWIALLLLIVTAFKAIGGVMGNKTYLPIDKKLATFTVMFFHIQVVIGFILFFGNKWHQLMGEMKEPSIRFFTVEHSIGMLLAAILLTIGSAKAKKASSDAKKHKTIAWMFTIVLLVVLACIPWPFREMFAARGWF